MLSGAFLSRLDAEQKEMVVDAFLQHDAKKGDNIIVQGEEGDFFYMLESGSADAFVASEGHDPKLVMEYAASPHPGPRLGRPGLAASRSGGLGALVTWSSLMMLCCR